MNEYVRKFRFHEDSYFPPLDRHVSVDQIVTITETRSSVPRNVCVHPTWYNTMLQDRQYSSGRLAPMLRGILPRLSNIN